MMRALRQRFPARFQRISTAQIQAHHGKLKATPTRLLPSHCTLWKYRDIELHDVFEVLE
jgi:hypothetical protein